MLVVLEGLDGAGKSTQVRKLKEFLQDRFGNLKYIHFPRYETNPYGQLIGKFLRGGFGSIENVHPQLVALLFAEDRHQAADEIKEALNRGECVLLDRYVYSNIAYQCAKISDPAEADKLRDWIFDTEYGTFDLPKPDLNIFMDVPISFVEKSLSEQREGDDRSYLQGKKDIHEASLEFQKEVSRIYKKQAEMDPDFIVVDCADGNGNMLPEDDIFSRIKSVIDR